MTQTSKTIGLSASLVITLCAFGWALSSDDTSAGAPDAKVAAIMPRPVANDMHHFMEYVFEPNYKRLKAGMADEPKSKKAWKAIKGDALTLAECANLLLIRVPDEGADEWRKLSVAVRSHGDELYQAARKSNYASARNAYRNMLTKCNACHKQFADGKHQLQP